MLPVYQALRVRVMKKTLTIKQVMTPFPYSVSTEDALDTAVELMRKHEIRHLPVVSGDELVGVLSDRDVHLLRENLTIGQRLDALTVGDACVRDIYVVDLNELLVNVLANMARRHIGSTLVTKQGKLAGLFTVTDACRVFADYLQDELPHGGSDVA